MTLKSIIDADSFEKLTEETKAFYVKKEDGYVLETDTTEKLNEFRDNNRALFRENEEFKKKTTELESKLEQLEKTVTEKNEKELLSEGKIDELLTQRTEAMRQSYEEKLENLSKNYETAEKTLDIHIVENQIREEAIKANAKNDRAVNHIIRAIRPNLKRDGTNAVRVDTDGNVVMSDDGSTPQGIAEIVEELKVSDGFLFAESTGSGATGGQDQAVSAKKKIRRSEIGKYISEVSKGEVDIIDG
ncbi:MAG: hypothetical protein CMC15_14695 [Flavobacteriaceae bacterium]|nr:hypothetical protein [Flavobacteriaceae bacterium]|tara:strand:+ start:79 stop:813 length:735 start_codon:yes stop_codon:yes gene_type:complete